MSKQPMDIVGDRTGVRLVVPAGQVDDTKAQLVRLAGADPVIIMEAVLPDGRVELLVFGARLTPGQLAVLTAHLQDQAGIQARAESPFTNELDFDRPDGQA